MTQKIIASGAEANIILSNDFIIKDRISKTYRIKELDEKIRKTRTKSETKLLTKAEKIIPCPLPFFKPEVSNQIKMPFISGKKLSEHLDKLSLKDQIQICKQIGENIAKLHENHIIHGDLTTSNMILKDDEIFFIDFGLGYISKKVEDKAVDLHLLKQALEAKHFVHWKILFEEFQKAYSKDYSESKQIFERITAVERRGRYRH